MSLRVYQGVIAPGKLEVRLNPGPDGPFGLIELDEYHRSYIAVDTVADADDLIRAAREIKRMLLEAAQQPPAAAGDDSHPSRWIPAAEPAPRVLSVDTHCCYRYAIDGVVRYCVNDPGHVGDHADEDGNVLPEEDHGEGPAATAVPAQAIADETADSGEDEDVLLLDYDDAVAVLPDGDRVHTFLQGPMGALIGADWDRDAVLALLRETGRREVTGPAAQSMGHGLAAYRADGVPVFIATAQPESSRP